MELQSKLGEEWKDPYPPVEEAVVAHQYHRQAEECQDGLRGQKDQGALEQQGVHGVANLHMPVCWNGRDARDIQLYSLKTASMAYIPVHHAAKPDQSNQRDKVGRHHQELGP